MALFSYTARSALGEHTQGVVEALSTQAARDTLRKGGLEVEEIHEGAPSLPKEEREHFFPLLDTLRLYAGWLLAWYLLTFALGMLQEEGRLTFSLPIVAQLHESLAVLRTACGTFLFLLLSTIHKSIRGGVVSGTLLTLLGIALFTLFVLNT